MLKYLFLNKNEIHCPACSNDIFINYILFPSKWWVFYFPLFQGIVVGYFLINNRQVAYGVILTVPFMVFCADFLRAGALDKEKRNKKINYFKTLLIPLVIFAVITYCCVKLSLLVGL